MGNRESADTGYRQDPGTGLIHGPYTVFASWEVGPCEICGADAERYSFRDERGLLRWRCSKDANNWWYHVNRCEYLHHRTPCGRTPVYIVADNRSVEPIFACNDHYSTDRPPPYN